MKKLSFLFAAAAGIMSGPAMAAPIVFELKDVLLAATGGPVALTGTFTTNETLNQLLAVNITSTAASLSGFSFAAHTYNDASQANWVSLPTQGFQITVAGFGQLRLNMFLTSTGATSLPNAYEYQSLAGSRSVVSGSVVRYVAPAAPAVPEPASWALMIVGFAAVGGAMRSRVRQQAALAQG